MYRKFSVFLFIILFRSIHFSQKSMQHSSYSNRFELGECLFYLISTRSGTYGTSEISQICSIQAGGGGRGGGLELRAKRP